MDNTTYTAGQQVRIVDEFNGRDSHVGTGNVVRVTKTQIVVDLTTGHQMRFRVKDARQVGYAFPQLMWAVRPAL